MVCLLIHDREEDYGEVRKVLADSGYLVFDAFSGAEAIQLLADQPEITMALIDASVPAIGAFPLAVYIRLSAPETMTIIVVASFSLLMMRFALEAGCNELVAKPVSAKYMVSLIKTKHHNIT